MSVDETGEEGAAVEVDGLDFGLCGKGSGDGFIFGGTDMEDGVVLDEKTGGEGGRCGEADGLAWGDRRGEEDAAVGEEGYFGHFEVGTLSLFINSSKFQV